MDKVFLVLPKLDYEDVIEMTIRVFASKEAAQAYADSISNEWDSVIVKEQPLE